MVLDFVSLSVNTSKNRVGTQERLFCEVARGTYAPIDPKMDPSLAQISSLQHANGLIVAVALANN